MPTVNHCWKKNSGVQRVRSSFVQHSRSSFRRSTICAITPIRSTGFNLAKCSQWINVTPGCALHVSFYFYLNRKHRYYWYSLSYRLTNTSALHKDYFKKILYKYDAASFSQGTATFNIYLLPLFKWPSHISVWALRMPAYDDFLSFVVIRWCTSAARREVVERAFRARCHTHSYVGARCVRRGILCMHKNSLRMPTYGPHAASTLCTRYANVPRVRGTVGVRWRNVHSTLTLVDTNGVNFTTSPLRVGSEFWTFCQRTVCVFSAYAYRIKIESALVSVFIARSHRMRNERVAFA